MANPTVREVVSTSFVATNQTLTTSGAVMKGDFIVAFFTNDYGSVNEINNSITYSDPSEPMSYRGAADGGTNQLHIKMWTGYVSQSGPKSLTCFQTNSWASTFTVIVISNHYGFGNFGWLSDSNADNLQPTPNLTPPAADCLFLTCFAAKPVLNYTAPTGMDILIETDVDPYNTMAVAYAGLSSSAATAFGNASTSVATSGVAAALSLTVRGTAQGTSIWPLGSAPAGGVGSPAISPYATITAAGRPSTLAFGTSGVSIAKISLAPSGMTSTQTAGAPSVSARGALYPAGRPSTLAFGASRISIANISLSPTGLAPTSAFGDGSSFSVVNKITITAAGWASGSAWGAPSITPGPVSLAPSGLPPTLGFGTSAMGGKKVIYPTGVGPTSAMPASLPALGNAAAIGPPSLLSTVRFGADLLAPGRFLIPGIGPTSVLGFPTLVPPIEPEWHKRATAPVGTTVRRPGPLPGRGTKFLTVDAVTRQVTNEFDFKSVSYEFERNLPGQFSGQIGLYDPESRFLVAQQTFLVVERNGQPFWTGFIWQPERSGKMLTVGAQGIWSIFGHRYVRDPLKWVDVDRAQILRDLVTYGQQGLGGDLGIAVGSELCGDKLSYGVDWWSKKSIATVADEVTKIDPSLTFSIQGKWLPGNRLGFTLVIDTQFPRYTPHRLVYGGNVDDYGLSPLSPSPNFEDAFGGFDNAAMLRKSAAHPDLARMVRIEGTVSNRDLLYEDPVAKLAVDTLRKSTGSPAQPTVSMSAGVSPALGELMPGQSTEVAISDGPYINVDDSFVVDKVSVKVPDGSASTPGAEQVSMEFVSVLTDELLDGDE